jgi:hypothetical protein
MWHVCRSLPATAHDTFKLHQHMQLPHSVGWVVAVVCGDPLPLAEAEDRCAAMLVYCRRMNREAPQDCIAC